MQGVFRKLYMSILAATMILLTTIATTFAWVGMLTSSSLGSFDIDLKVEDFDNDYYLKISGTDSTNSDGFGDAVKKIDVQRQIMDNMNIPYKTKNFDINDASAIDTYFTRTAAVRLRPTTTDRNLQYFKEYKDMNQLKKIILIFIASRLSEKDIDNLKEIFKAFDKNNDGQIGYNEFEEGLKKLGIKESEISSYFNSIDTDKNGIFAVENKMVKYELKQSGRSFIGSGFFFS